MALPDLDSSVGHSFGLEFDGITIKSITEVTGLKMEQDVVELKQNGPDGKYVIASQAGAQGMSPGLVSIYDAKSGALGRGYKLHALWGDAPLPDGQRVVRPGHRPDLRVRLARRGRHQAAGRIRRVGVAERRGVRRHDLAGTATGPSIDG